MGHGELLPMFGLKVLIFELLVGSQLKVRRNLSGRVCLEESFFAKVNLQHFRDSMYINIVPTVYENMNVYINNDTNNNKKKNGKKNDNNNNVYIYTYVHVPWGSKDHHKNNQSLGKYHHFSRDLQSTIPGDYFFNGLWLPDIYIYIYIYSCIFHIFPNHVYRYSDYPVNLRRSVLLGSHVGLLAPI